MEINKPVNFVLSPPHLQIVLKALEDQPYRIAQPVMEELFQQIRKQFNGQDTPPLPTPKPDILQSEPDKIPEVRPGTTVSEHHNPSPKRKGRSDQG
jgi:hypothetical protein